MQSQSPCTGVYTHTRPGYTWAKAVESADTFFPRQSCSTCTDHSKTGIKVGDRSHVGDVLPTLLKLEG